MISETWYQIPDRLAYLFVEAVGAVRKARGDDRALRIVKSTIEIHARRADIFLGE